MNSIANTVNTDQLFRLRLIIARYGEMDISRWWNTKGQLGPSGAMAVRRGFPRTHYFAQARSVFAVAANRCIEVFNPPKCVTLWNLPEEIEESFEASWERWLDQASDWDPFFKSVASIGPGDLGSTLLQLKVVAEDESKAFANLKRSAEGRAVPISHVFSGTTKELSLLALGFARGEPGALAVPYMQRER